MGLEDNLYISKGVLAKSNAELVEKAVRLASEMDHRVMGPDEARQMLGTKGMDKVKY
ncbi:MAG: 3-keto-5-aminohexanoate cleavage protein [Desulfarculaceae bacterium]